MGEVDVPHHPRHTSSLSQDTNASRLADSTISYGDSLRLSQFPDPPASIPTTPINFDFNTPSLGHKSSNFRSTPRVLERKQPSSKFLTESLTTDTYLHLANRNKPPLHSTPPHQATRYQTVDHHSLPSSTAHSLSPYDWHDGASSIGMDATEDRLLSTSFITSLLQESTGLRTNRPASANSDALSRFSEMTYPPLASSFSSDQTSPHYAVQVRELPRRLQDRRPPSTAFIQTPTSLGRLSELSNSVYPRVDHISPVFRKAGVSQPSSQGTSIIGFVPTTDYSVDENNDTSLYCDPSGMHSENRSPIQHEVSDTTNPLSNHSSQPIQKRGSVHSVRGSATSFISRISSQRSIHRVLTWRKVKPLPPVPTLSGTPIATENACRRADESRSLPELVNRAGTLQALLEKGYHPHRSLISHYVTSKREGPISAFDETDTISREVSSVNSPDPNYKSLQALISQLPKLPENYHPKRYPYSGKKKRIFIVLGVFLVVVLAAIGTAVGLSIHGKKDPDPVCSGNLVGAACNLDATCVCTSQVPGRCDGLAQNLVDLIPALNQFAHRNFTSSMVYKNIWFAQGTVPGRNCASQSRLVDVAPALNAESFPEQVAWAQTVLLWNLVESQDIPAVIALQKFIQKAPWKTLNQVDPVAFSTTISGYNFNFATRQVTQPDQSFVVEGQPTRAQTSQVDSSVRPVLDRMYSFAVASSIQHQTALLNYWTTVLQQKPADLKTFMAALSASPIMLPFDAVSQVPGSPSTLLKNASSSFPPPLACYPTLSSIEKQSLDLFEGQVFGLPPIHTPNNFETSCFPDRPLYGVLNVLRLRLPFNNTGPSVARQAVVLRREVSPRIIVYNGPAFSTLPGSSNTPALTTTQLDPRRYGVMSQYNHIVLDYLSSIPDIDVTLALVNYILDSTSQLATPPSNTSLLFHSIATIPVLEVAVFGTIGPSDIDSAVSAFTTSSETFFFGSDQAGVFHDWVISDRLSSIAWAESAFSPLIVRDKGFSDQAFKDTWDAVALALHSDVKISLVNVTNAFRDTHRFVTS